MSERIPADQVAEVMSEVTIMDGFSAAREVPIGGEVLPILAADTHGMPSKAGDIVAIWSRDDPAFRPARLAAGVPAKGERVWLAASVSGGASPEERLHAATSCGKDEFGNFIYEYDNRKLVLSGTSGAPVLNAAGEVVAINVGVDKIPNRLFGIGNPVDRFRPHPETAASVKKRR
jgi:hypothetical protein